MRGLPGTVQQWRRKGLRLLIWLMLPALALVGGMGWHFDKQSRRYHELSQQIKQLVERKSRQLEQMRQRLKSRSIPSRLYFHGSPQHLRLQLKALLRDIPVVRLLEVKQQRPNVFKVKLMVPGNPPLLAGVLKRLPPYLVVTRITGQQGEGFNLTCMVLIQSG